jgi:hypothetical protein
MARQRRYDEATFRAAVADPVVLTMADLCRALGLVPRGANYETLRQYADELGLQLRQRTGKRRHPLHDVPADDLASAIEGSRSIAEALRQLGIPPTASSYRIFRGRVRALDLELHHHAGQGWARARTFPERWVAIERFAETADGVRLRQRLVALGLREHRCERCGLGAWLDEPIPLEVDHVDGDRRNNALDNLRLLCPNCHALTPTYRGRNIGRYGDDVAREPPSVWDRTTLGRGSPSWQCGDRLKSGELRVRVPPPARRDGATTSSGRGDLALIGGAGIGRPLPRGQPHQRSRRER